MVIEAYDDPKVQGVTCFVSRARTGGMKGTVGLAEDRAEASIACRQVAEVLYFSERLPRQEDVFTERMSILFKRLHVVRVVDPKRNALVYLTYSDRLIEGSPQNSVTAVPVTRRIPYRSNRQLKVSNIRNSGSAAWMRLWAAHRTCFFPTCFPAYAFALMLPTMPPGEKLFLIMRSLFSEENLVLRPKLSPVRRLNK